MFNDSAFFERTLRGRFREKATNDEPFTSWLSLVTHIRFHGSNHRHRQWLFLNQSSLLKVCKFCTSNNTVARYHIICSCQPQNEMGNLKDTKRLLNNVGAVPVLDCMN